MGLLPPGISRAPPGDGEALTLNEESLKIRAETLETGRKEPGELLFPRCSGAPALEPQDERALCLLLPEMTARSLSAEKPAVSKIHLKRDTLNWLVLGTPDALVQQKLCLSGHMQSV